MKTTFLIMAALVCGCISVSPIAVEPADENPAFDAGVKAAGAPPELAHWAKLVGQWSTQEESLKTDGSGWEPSKGADWNFRWAFDGWGIQDDYSSPPVDVELDDESSRQRGINLRVFNPAENKWIMTWLTVASTKPATFTATSDEERLVMHSDVVNPQGFHSRITLFDITPDSFEWKLELSKDRQQWLEVYRIHGTRKPG